MADSPKRPWWIDPHLPGIDFLPTLDQGLSSEEARIRLAHFGPNLLLPQDEKSLLRQYLERFKNPLVLILLGASLVSAMTEQVTNFLMIGAIVLLSVTLDFFQEHKANAAAAKLRQSVSLRASGIRDGKSKDIAVSSLVPGDLISVSAGDLIPADGVVLEAHDFFVKQALLTGEPYPVEKRPGVLTDLATDIQDATNAVFMGTSVISGKAMVRVIQTGMTTEMGRIAESLSRQVAPSSFEVGVRQFGLLIMRLTMVMVLFVLFVNAWFHKPWLDSFLFAVALAVGLTPELLPMVISVTLARGAMRMASKHMIVKRLAAIQDLGSMDVLCTDKTGTLTEAKIVMERHVDPQGQSSERVLELAYLNSFFESGLKNPIDEAILAHAHLDVSGWTKVDEVPFDFERRCVSVLIDNGRERWLLVKGAADEILRLCTHYEVSELPSPRAMDAHALTAAQLQFQTLESQGLRVLGIAWRQVPLDHPHAVISDEVGLVLAGFAAFLDPPKVSAAPALDSLEKAGVSVKVVTGDSELVTRHVCTQMGMDVTGLLTGKDIEQMDDHALRARVDSVNLFCRVNPAQKSRVIQALRARGHVVGYLGDGINDAPSLHAADVGLSVDSAVDVAKEAADMILLKRDLQVLHEGVLEGRRTFGNIMKYIMMGASSNFGNMFSMAGAALFLPFLPMLPTQILLNNILYDGSELAIPLDQVDEQDLAVPRVLDVTLIRNFMLVLGAISSVFDFLTFYVMLVVLKADEKLFQTGWFVESLCTQVLVIFVIRTRGNPFKSHPHPLLIACALGVAALGAGLPFTPLGVHFGFVRPPIIFYAMLGGMVLAYLLAAQMAKQAFYRGTTSTRRRAFRGPRQSQ
ncbi:magnesium-translocating P-type ATPase [Aquabacterium sp.]|uniref:magnesium-translocating P-type ATPase n=1 Tax=Aquabacterium sp. TaxID=1872578 RepID=UPI002E36D0BC|nr:magnesium-translocating P-type ATPase [Aquabacterium sp.]HEX5311991.1 magnesium-translocating P-type ATPase [Aquabacterium sp.]